MSRLIEALKNSADGAFVIDESLRIVYCNKVAEAILGLDNQDIVGHFCYQLLRGHDDGMHLVCKARCQVARMALNSKPVPNYDIQITTNYGIKRWLNMSVLAYRTGDNNEKKVIVHLFHDLNHKKVNERILTQNIRMGNCNQDFPTKSETEMGPHLKRLTPREQETLALLAKGHSTGEIGERLSISQNTARNHVQHVLQKLQVHSRLEAVAYVFKHDIHG
jgi:PAS domain S-box-containing protein